MEPDLSEDDTFLMTIYEWIDTIPLSKDKKNIARDFADGMLLAELIKHYYPKLIEIHNYPSASSTKQKLCNWNTLCVKVLKKLNLTVKQSEINDIIASKPKAIEKLLVKLYRIIHKQPLTTSNNKETNEKIEKKELTSIKDINDEIKQKEEEFVRLTNRRQEIEKQLYINSGVSDNLQQKIKKLSKMLQV